MTSLTIYLFRASISSSRDRVLSPLVALGNTPGLPLVAAICLVADNDHVLVLVLVPFNSSTPGGVRAPYKVGEPPTWNFIAES